MALRDDLLKLRGYIDALLESQAAVDGIEAVENPPAPPDPVAALRSIRNIVLAGSDDKAELMGTMEAEPVVDVDALRELGVLASTANAMIAARDSIRDAALALSAQVDQPPIVMPPEKLPPVGG